MNLPYSTIRGFFEILMPGIFLLLNGVAAVALGVNAWPLVELAAPVSMVLHDSAFVAAIVISIGYMLGVILRMRRCEAVDSLSAAYCRILQPERAHEAYLTESFSYSTWLESRIKDRLPIGFAASAGEFFEAYWVAADREVSASRTHEDSEANVGNWAKRGRAISFLLAAIFLRRQLPSAGTAATFRINFLKMQLLRCHEQCANEVFHLEALSRFVAGTFHALRLATIVVTVAAVLLLAFSHYLVAGVAAVVAVIYAIAMHYILCNYRFLRIKEAESTFSACFANREEFETLAGQRHREDPKPEA